MSDPVVELKKAIELLGIVTWVNSGENKSENGEPEYHDCWVKFGLPKSENGWRALEFLAWAVDDLQNSGYRIRFVPTSPPPYLNSPGECLAFVIEVDLLAEGKTALQASNFLQSWVNKYWSKCHLQPAL